MSVRAKFQLVGIEASMTPKVTMVNGVPVYDGVHESRSFRFSPVYHHNDPAHENNKFWTASPSGELRLGIVKPEIWPLFEVGKEYYLDFTPAN